MMKMYLTIVVVLQVVGIIYGILIGDLLGAVLQNAVHLTKGILGPLCFIGPVGYIAIPFNSICKIPVVGKDYLFCSICNQDCIVAHNTYGGNCGPSPITGKTICLCANTQEEASDRGIYTTTRGTCGNVPIGLSYLNDELISGILRKRMQLLECPESGGVYETSGCVTDCKDNRGYKNGYCGVTMPVALNNGTEPILHCECNND